MHPISHYLWYCHRLPERSFFYRGKKFPVCARCTGVWIGYLIGLPIALCNVLPWWSGIILLMPALIDGGSQLLKWRNSTNSLRLVTGMALGIGEILLVIAFGRLAYLFGTLAAQWLILGG